MLNNYLFKTISTLFTVQQQWLNADRAGDGIWDNQQNVIKYVMRWANVYETCKNNLKEHLKNTVKQDRYWMETLTVYILSMTL